MLIAMRPVVAVRGSLFSIKYKFERDKEPREKFCVLMEDYVKGKKDLVVVFTTRNLNFASRKTAVPVAGGVIRGLPEDTVIECHNFAIISCEYLLKDEEVEYICQIQPEIMQSINEAVEHIQKIDEKMLARMVE